MFCFIKPIKEKLHISWTAFPLKQPYIESWAMVESGSSWLDEWLVIKGAFTNSHDLQTQLLAVDYTYGTDPFRFHSYGVYIVTILRRADDSPKNRKVPLNGPHGR